MAEQDQGPVQPAQEAAPVTPAPEPAPEPSPAPPPAKYEGKTLEEFKAEAEQKDAFITTLAQEKARAEHDAAYARTLLEQLGKGPQAPAAAPAEPVLDDDEFLRSPAKSTYGMLKSLMDKERQEREQKERQQIIFTARTNYEMGRANAIKSSPKLYSGIENEVSQAVFQAFETGQLRPEQLNSAEIWDATAKLTRIMRGELNLEKYYDHRPTPMPPAPTETPGASLPSQATAMLTPEQEEAARRAGFTREQFLEMWKKTQAEKEWRAK